MLRESNVISYTSEYFVSNSSLAASVSRGYASAAKYLVYATASNPKPNLMVPFEVRIDLDLTTENMASSSFGIVILGQRYIYIYIDTYIHTYIHTYTQCL